MYCFLQTYGRTLKNSTTLRLILLWDKTTLNVGHSWNAVTNVQWSKVHWTVYNYIKQKTTCPNLSTSLALIIVTDWLTDAFRNWIFNIHVIAILHHLQLSQHPALIISNRSPQSVRQPTDQSTDRPNLCNVQNNAIILFLLHLGQGYVFGVIFFLWKMW